MNDNITRHFLELHRLSTATLREILDLAGTLKKAHAEGKAADLFASKTLVMIFEKPSTRTRVSFQVAMQQLGGHVVVVSEGESQLGRGETIAGSGASLDRVANFHLTNGARIERINWIVDTSHKGLGQAAGMMVNYRYKPGGIEANHEAFKGAKRIVASSAVKSLLSRRER